MTATKNPNNNHVVPVQDNIPIVTTTTVPTNYGATTPLVVPETVTFDEAQPPMVNDAVAPLIVTTAGDVTTTAAEIKDEILPTFRDVPFAILFLAQFGAMLWLGIAVAPSGYEKITWNLEDIVRGMMRKSDDFTDDDLRQFEEFVQEFYKFLGVYPLRILLYFIVPLGVLSYLNSLAATIFVRACPRTIVYVCLAGSIAVTAVAMILFSIQADAMIAYILTALSLLAVMYYVSVAWKIVPYAAVNLKVALVGISRNCGMFMVAFIMSELSFVWMVYWFYVVVGVCVLMDARCRQAHPEANFDVTSEDFDDICTIPGPILIAFLVSLYWTSTVINNTIQVTVSGVMATWCFDKTEASNCCSPAVYGSLFRSLTYSFGSICLGSLLQALVSMLRSLIKKARDQRDQNDNGCASLIFCIFECLANLLEELLEYFNQWAYVFVGIYGFSYLESGRRVIELFKARGWTSIITDNLVGYVLAVTSLMVGIVTGLLGLLIDYVASDRWLEDQDPNNSNNSAIFGPLPGWRFWAFGIGFFVGVAVSTVVVNVVKGAVNALIVCWADSPSILEKEHPGLTKEMAESWSDVFPEANVYVRPTQQAQQQQERAPPTTYNAVVV